MSRSGMVVMGAVCALCASCAFDPHGASVQAGDGDDAPGGADAATPPPHPPADAGPPGQPDAAPPPPELGVLKCRRALVPPLLDGVLDEWPAGDETHLDMAGAAQVLDETPLYSMSMGAKLRCAHDDQRIYFAVEVSDDRSVADSISLYDDDSVHFYLDARGDAGGRFGTDDHWLVVRVDGTAHDYAQGAAPLRLAGEVVPDPVTGDFVVEISVDKDSLGVVGALPARLGFDLALSDNDGVAQFAYGLWYLSQRPTCSDCCTAAGGARAWCDTTTFGSLQLE